MEFPFQQLLSRFTVPAVFLTWLRLLVAGVRERPGVGSVSVTDGHIFRSVRPGEAAGVSRRPTAISSQLNGSPQRPTRFESWRRLLRRWQASDPRLRPVAVVYSRPALPCLKTKVLPLLVFRRLFCLFLSNCDFFFLFYFFISIERLSVSRLTTVNNGLSLKSLAADLLNVCLDKSLELRCSDWEADQLTLEQVVNSVSLPQICKSRRSIKMYDIQIFWGKTALYLF